MKFNLLLTAALLLTVSCGKKSDSAQIHNKALQTLGNNQGIQGNFINFAFRPKYPQPSTQNQKTFAKNFCNFVSSSPNPFTIEKYISNEQALQSLTGQLGYLGRNRLTCKFKKEIYDHYPLQLVEYETSIGYSIYVHYLYNEKYQVAQSAISLIAGQMSVDHIKIPMTDGKALSTFIYKTSSAPKGTVLIRTPYYHTGPMYLNMADNFMRKGYHVAVQSNRGSHLSDGEFRWLSKQNSKDAYDTIEYLAKQPFSNGKVVSYGVSYDGFNALASGIDTPPSLTGIIACSAPANAATDSFTSNMTPEAFLLTYVWERETNSPIKHFMQKYMYLKEIGTPSEEIDNKIFGRDVADWDDYLKDQQKYYEDRNLLDGINKINVPTIHVAGLTNDQDGRDTILAYESLQKNAQYKEMHRLLLHNAGHGCGPFGQSSEFDQYLSLASDAPSTPAGAKVRQHSNTLQGYASGSQYPLTNDFKDDSSLLSGAVDGLHQQLNQSDFVSRPIGYFYDAIQPITQSYTQNTFVIPMPKKTMVSGTPKLKLNAIVSAPDTVIYADVYIIRPDGSTKTFSNVQRTGVVWKQALNTQQEVTLTLPPTLTTISAESQIIIQLSTKKSWIIQPETQAREDFFSTTNFAPVVILDGSELVLPTEVDQFANNNSISSL